jgi:5-methylcytosine-specific restriction protein A
MPAYLLTWNPKRFSWDNLGEMSDAVQNGSAVVDSWSCGNNKSIQKGDRVFLIRLGIPPKGIMGSGHVVDDSYTAPHWDAERAEQGEVCRFVDIQFDRLLDPLQDTILPRDLLNWPPFNKVHWGTQSSGIRIADDVATELELLWSNYSEASKFMLPDEVSFEEEVFHEGALRQITVNAFERNSAARQKCIEIHGTKCSICGIEFGSFYGEAVEGYIHVHHLKPLSEIGETYKVNPAEDLIPICPYCHAVIHSKKPPYSPEEVRGMIGRR